MIHAHAISPASDVMARKARLGMLSPKKRVEIKRPRHIFVRPDANQHVLAYRSWLKMYAEGTRPAEFIRLGCQLLGIDAKTILSHFRAAEVVAVRYEMMRMTKARYPKLSTSRLGVLFNKDHTIICRALKTMNIPSRYSPCLTVDQAIEIRRRYIVLQHLGKDIAKDFGVSTSTVYKIGKRQIWRNV